MKKRKPTLGKRRSNESTLEDINGIPSIVHPSLIITSQKTSGTRSTLASRLGEMFLVAENLYGKRDRSYTFLGIEFTEDKPHIHWERNNNTIIRLHLSALHNPIEAYAQMAHECIHLLSPCPKKPVTILEEGMAEVFAYIYVRDTMKINLPKKPAGSAYHEAAELVAMLLHVDNYGIKRIREEQPTISLISKSLIWKHYPILEEGVAARLARTFVRDGCTDPYILEIYNHEGMKDSRDVVVQYDSEV